MVGLWVRSLPPPPGSQEMEADVALSTGLLGNGTGSEARVRSLKFQIDGLLSFPFLSRRADLCSAVSRVLFLLYRLGIHNEQGTYFSSKLTFNSICFESEHMKKGGKHS